MKNTVLLLIAFACYPLSAYADFSVQGVRTSCTKDAFEVSAYTLMNETPKKAIIEKGEGNEIYFGTAGRVVTCQVGKRILKAEISNEEPRERGACGGAPGSDISIWIDGVVVMQRQLFNNDCYQSLDRLVFSQSEWIGFVTKICGHTRGMYVEMEGCFDFKEDAFLSLKFPLSPFPLEDLIANKALQLTPKSGAAER
ncbi:MAG: hypothetical protein K8H75_00835 [Sulfuricella sp.]|nr:hypothetical protein [Sulfuricella sp.]